MLAGFLAGPSLSCPNSPEKIPLKLLLDIRLPALLWHTTRLGVEETADRSVAREGRACKNRPENRTSPAQPRVRNSLMTAWHMVGTLKTEYGMVLNYSSPAAPVDLIWDGRGSWAFTLKSPVRKEARLALESVWVLAQPRISFVAFQNPFFLGLTS